MKSIFLVFHDSTECEEIRALTTEAKAEEIAREMIREHITREPEINNEKLESLLDDTEHDITALLEHFYWSTHGTAEIRIEELTLDLPLRAV